MFDRFAAPFIVSLCCIVVAVGLVLAFNRPSPMWEKNAGFPHPWFAWHPVRLQGGRPIPSVQLGGRIVWLKTIERYRFFDHWVYREIGDTRELTQ